MDAQRDIYLIDHLRQLPAETQWVEFKHNNSNPKMIGEKCSALSNSARLEQQDFGYLIWGIEDETHKVLGTDFDFISAKISDQPLEMWLAQRLKPSINFCFRSVDHPDGRLVLLEIPSATSAPVSFDGHSRIRIGNTTPKLVDYPERHRGLIEALSPFSWEQGIAAKFLSENDVLELLDYQSYFTLTKQHLPENEQSILEFMAGDELVIKDVGKRWNITNLGAILFANDLGRFSSSLSRKAIRFVAYNGKNKAATVTHRIDGKKGYANGFEGLLGFINDLLPKNEHIGQAFRETQPLFPELAIRELVANALIHQDMTISGTGPQIELFEDRIEIINPGIPLVAPDRMIDMPPRSRNEALAALMRRMNICEEQGSGLDKVIVSVELFQLPPPWFRALKTATHVILYGARTFANMSPEERIRACYQHSIIKWLSGDRMKNSTLCERFGIDSKNAAQATLVLNNTKEAGLIKVADPKHPRAGYIPNWA